MASLRAPCRTKYLKTAFTRRNGSASKRLAKTVYLPPARFVREASVGHSFTARVNSAAILQLIRLATNLNQLTKLAHTLREVDPAGRLGPLLAKVNGTLDELL